MQSNSHLESTRKVLHQLRTSALDPASLEILLTVFNEVLASLGDDTVRVVRSEFSGALRFHPNGPEVIDFIDGQLALREMGAMT